MQCPTCPNVVLAQEECQGRYCDLSRLAKLTQPAFEHGSTVVVVSLVSRIDLNGGRGIVQMFMPGSGRYEVKVDGEPASIALKSENLQSAPEIGSGVILVSLANASYLNGRSAIVQGFNSKTNLFELKVVDEEAIFSLKAGNIREVPQQFEPQAPVAQAVFDPDDWGGQIMPEEYGHTFRASLAEFRRIEAALLRQRERAIDLQSLYLEREREPLQIGTIDLPLQGPRPPPPSCPPRGNKMRAGPPALAVD